MQEFGTLFHIQLRTITRGQTCLRTDKRAIIKITRNLATYMYIKKVSKSWAAAAVVAAAATVLKFCPAAAAPPFLNPQKNQSALLY